MGETPRDKWNRIYTGSVSPGSVAAVLVDNADLLPSTGDALDIACGSGANAFFLAEHGLEVEAWDISDVVVEALRSKGLNAVAGDITVAAFEGRQFDVIVNCHYLDRTITEPMIKALSPGGLVFFQTFLRHRALETGPKNPDFLLKDGELQAMMAGLEIMAERSGAEVTEADNPIGGRAYIVARKPLQQ